MAPMAESEGSASEELANRFQSLKERPWQKFIRRLRLPRVFSQPGQSSTGRLLVGAVLFLGGLAAAGYLWRTYAPARVKPSEARAALETLWASQQVAALKALREGERLFEAEDYAKAHAAFSTAINQGADETYAHFLRGLSAVKLGKHLQAIKDFSVLMNLDPANPALYAKRGEAFEGLGSYQQAMRDYHQALQLNPNGSPSPAEILLHQSRVYRQLKDYPQALDTATKAIELAPERSEGYFHRALVYDLMERYPPALEDYGKALQLAPNFQPAYLNRGVTNLKLQKYDQALADLNKAIELAPQNHQAYFHRGMLHTHQGNYNQALSDLETGAALGSHEARYMIRHVKLYEKSHKQQVVAKKSQLPLAEELKSRPKTGGSKARKGTRKRR